MSHHFKTTGPILRCFLAAWLLGAAAIAGPITRVPVESSNLRSVGFDAKEKVLEVQFQHGGPGGIIAG